MYVYIMYIYWFLSHNKVLDSILGWLNFRKAYERWIVIEFSVPLCQHANCKSFRTTWDFLRALLRPQFLLSSASLSDASVLRICGNGSLISHWKFNLILICFLETLGIDKRTLLTFHSSSSKTNVHLQLRSVEKFHPRLMILLQWQERVKFY